MAFGGSTSAGVGDESVPTRTLCAPLVGARTAPGARWGAGRERRSWRLSAVLGPDPTCGSSPLSSTLPVRNSAVAPLTLFQTALASPDRFALARPRPLYPRGAGTGRRRQRRAPPRCVESGLPLPAARGRRAMWLSGAAWSDSDGYRAKGDALNWRGRRHCSHDHPCVLPGTSAPRSTSSRSVTLTVLAFGFTSHQYAAASSSFQALLSSRSRPVHHTSRKRRASVSLGHSARSGWSASVSSIHS